MSDPAGEANKTPEWRVSSGEEHRQKSVESHKSLPSVSNTTFTAQVLLQATKLGITAWANH